MKRLVTGAAALISAAMMMSCASKGEVKVLIENDSDLSRVNETVELDFNALKAGIEGLTADNAVVLDAEGKQVPVQVYTERHAEELLIFQASVPAGEAVEFTVSAGVREPYDTLVYSRYVPERADDYAYENNLVAGRIYGPALADPRTFGPDIWLKCTGRLIVDEWYEKADYHHNYGDGMDCYKVANTLGGGALAPYVGDKIVIGDNYASQERICDGPVRTKAVLRYDAFDVDGNLVSAVKEISLDANTRFLKTSTWFDCVNLQEIPVVLGAVLHDVVSRTDGDHYIAFTEKASDSSDPGRDGDISVGLVVDAAEQGVEAATMDGHAVLKAVAVSGKRFDVWTGSGWSQGGVESPEAWAQAVKDFAYAQAHPLKVTVK